MVASVGRATSLMRSMIMSRLLLGDHDDHDDDFYDFFDDDDEQGHEQTTLEVSISIIFVTK